MADWPADVLHVFGIQSIYISGSPVAGMLQECSFSNISWPKQERQPRCLIWGKGLSPL